MIFVRSAGKRGIVFASFIGCGLCFFAVPTFAYITGTKNELFMQVESSNQDFSNEPNDNIYNWIPLVLLLAGSTFAHMGAKLFPWMLIGEVNMNYYIKS